MDAIVVFSRNIHCMFCNSYNSQGKPDSFSILDFKTSAVCGAVVAHSSGNLISNSSSWVRFVFSSYVFAVLNFEFHCNIDFFRGFDMDT